MFIDTLHVYNKYFGQKFKF